MSRNQPPHSVLAARAAAKARAEREASKARRELNRLNRRRAILSARLGAATQEHAR